MIIAPENFRDEECFIPKERFEKEGAKVVVASKKAGTCKGMLGGEIEAIAYEVDVPEYDAVVFVGGSGADVYFDDVHAHSIAREAYDLDKVLGAICIAPSTLANAGLLQGKKATCYASEKGNLEAKGAEFTGETVTVDGKIVTGNGPRAAKEFADEIVKLW